MRCVRGVLGDTGRGVVGGVSPSGMVRPELASCIKGMGFAELGAS